MKLIDLEPRFMKITDAVPQSHLYVDSIGEADGIMFLCPKCFAEKGGRPGVHMVICWGPDVPQTIEPTPGRWRMEGTGYGDLTLVGGSSSILLTSPAGCKAHFFIRNGGIDLC